jgi:hypothetical protein
MQLQQQQQLLWSNQLQTLKSILIGSKVIATNLKATGTNLSWEESFALHNRQRDRELRAKLEGK